MSLAFLNLPGPFWTEIRLNIRQFDYLGSLCLTAGTFCILSVLASDGTVFPWISGHAVGLSIAGLALLGFFCFIEPLVPDPLLHSSLFLDDGLVMTVIMAILYGANLYGTLYYVPHFFQLVLHDGAFISSLCILPMTVAMGVAAAGATFVSSRHRGSINSIAQGGAALVALASGLMVRWSTTTSREQAVLVLLLLGLGHGTAFIGLVRGAQIHVGRSAAGSGSRLFMFFQVLGAAFGVAGFAALYTTRLQSTLGALVPDIAKILPHVGNDEDDYAASMKPDILDAYGFSMQAGWFLMFVCALAVLALRLVLERTYTREDIHMLYSDGAEKVSELEKGL